jgi:hypothetical protein
LKKGALAALLIAGTVQAASISTATVDTAATFTVASSPLGGVAGCELDGNLPNTYGTSTFTTTFAETYSFTAIGATGDPALVNDPFLAIYEGSFDPANPTVNLVGCNDDKSSADRFPEFSAALKANTTYVMVATTYAGGAQSGTVTISAGIVPALSLANFSASVGATGQSMVATSHSTGTITYSIDNPSVATIDPSTGALTLLAPGTATVTATIAPQPDTGPNAGPYNGGTTTATLTVTAATQSSVQPVPTLSEWAMIVMASMMGMLAISRIRRKN